MCRRWSMSQIPTSRSLRSSDDRLYLRVKAGSCSDWTMQSAFHERELGSFGEFRSEAWRRSLSLLRLPEPHEGSIGLCVCDVLACFVGALMGQCWRNCLFVVNWANFLERKAEIPFLVFSKCLRSEDTRQAARNNTYMRFTPCRYIKLRSPRMKLKSTVIPCWQGHHFLPRALHAGLSAVRRDGLPARCISFLVVRPAHELIKQIKLREEARRRAARSVPVLLERQEQQSEQALKAEHAAQRELVRLARAAEREALAELSRAKQEPRSLFFECCRVVCPPPQECESPPAAVPGLIILLGRERRQSGAQLHGAWRCTLPSAANLTD